MENLKTFLNENNIIFNEKLIRSIYSSINNKPLAGAFLYGPAGTGKTLYAEKISEYLDSETFFYQCFPGTREDDLLVKLLPSENTVSGVKINKGVILKACNHLKQGFKATLILDEWDKTRPSADAFLLDFLQSGRINYNGYSLKLTTEELNRLTVFLTLNDERYLSDPLLRRLPMIKFEPIQTKYIEELLKITHLDNPYLYDAIKLYDSYFNNSQKFTKPVTIQELKQFLDAAILFNENCDLNELVYQFITKDDSSHETLIGAIKDNNKKEKELEKEKIKIESLRANLITNEEKEEEVFYPVVENNTIPKDVFQKTNKRVFAIVENIPKTYNYLLDKNFNMNKDVIVNGKNLIFTEFLHINDVIKILNSNIVFANAINFFMTLPLKDFKRMRAIENIEVSCVEEDFLYGMIFKRIRFKYYLETNLLEMYLDKDNSSYVTTDMLSYLSNININKNIKNKKWLNRRYFIDEIGLKISANIFKDFNGEYQADLIINENVLNVFNDSCFRLSLNSSRLCTSWGDRTNYNCRKASFKFPTQEEACFHILLNVSNIYEKYHELLKFKELNGGNEIDKTKMA